VASARRSSGRKPAPAMPPEACSFPQWLDGTSFLSRPSRRAYRRNRATGFANVLPSDRNGGLPVLPAPYFTRTHPLSSVSPSKIKCGVETATPARRVHVRSALEKVRVRVRQGKAAGRFYRRRAGKPTHHAPRRANIHPSSISYCRYARRSRHRTVYRAFF